MTERSDFEIRGFSNLKDLMDYLYPELSDVKQQEEVKEDQPRERKNVPFQAISPVFIHGKTGNQYILLDLFAYEDTLELGFLYMSCSTGEKFGRPAIMFCDGRFIPQNALAREIIRQINHG